MLPVKAVVNTRRRLMCLFMKGAGEVRRYSHCRSASLESDRDAWDLEMYTQSDPPSCGLTSLITLLQSLEDGMGTSVIWLTQHHLFYYRILYQSISAGYLWIIWKIIHNIISKERPKYQRQRVMSYMSHKILSLCTYEVFVGTDVLLGIHPVNTLSGTWAHTFQNWASGWGRCGAGPSQELQLDVFCEEGLLWLGEWMGQVKELQPSEWSL